LQNFLASEKVKYGPDLFCPESEFKSTFNTHCTENNLGKPKFNPDFYMGPFGSRDLEVRTEARRYKGQLTPPRPYVFGLDLVDMTGEFNVDQDM